MVKANSSLVAENHPAVSAAPLKTDSGGWTGQLLAPPGALALLVLLFFGSWWFAGIAGPENPGRWVILTIASAFTVGYLALKRQCGRHLQRISQLEQAEERLQAELAEHARSAQIAQRAAEENRRTMWKVFKASPDPMAVLEARPGGIFLAVNQSFATIFGYARDEVLGKTPVQLKLPANPDNLADFSRKLEPEGYLPDAETAFRTKDGRIVWGLLSAVTVEVAGKPYVSWIVRDITDRKRIVTQLIAAREAAEAASRAKSEFLSSMSHEIRTPMNAILGMAQLLAETELSEDQRHYLDLMVVNGNSLLDLINSILDLAKIESGRMQIEHSEFDLAELVDKTIATFGVCAHSKGLELAARIAPDVPGWVVGDALRLRQILTNLLGNAIKFTDSGEIVLEVGHPALFHELAELQFTVTDTGIGIPPDKLDAIFDNFTQADSSTTRKYGGSGLGLAIAHRLVGLMGGRMSVESELGTGSRFSFTARFGQVLHANDSPLNSGRLPIPDIHPDTQQTAVRRILVAEDSPDNRLVIAAYLRREPYQVDFAEDGKQAFEQFTANLYDLVLMDIQMPEMDGLDATRAIRRWEFEHGRVPAPIVALTAYALEEDIRRTLSAGCNLHISKPLQKQALIECIQQAMQAGGASDFDRRSRPSPYYS